MKKVFTFVIFHPETILLTVIAYKACCPIVYSVIFALSIYRNAMRPIPLPITFKRKPLRPTIASITDPFHESTPKRLTNSPNKPVNHGTNSECIWV